MALIKMKIIFVVPNLSAGGAERVISILANSFLKKNIDVDILLLKNREVFYSISQGVNLVYLGNDLLLISKIKACRIIRSYLKNERKKYKKILLIPFLDVSLKRVLLASAGLRMTIIASERNDPYQKGNSISDRIKANLPYLMSSCCIFQTADAAKYYCMAVQKKSVVIMNPLTVPADICWRGKESKRIVSVGRLEPQKNQMMLLEAFEQVHDEYPEYILEIYGEGSMRDFLQAKIKELGLEQFVFLKGHSSNILSVLEKSFAFVLSSDYEGMSNALIEALAVGMPVVTTDHPCGGARALVDDGINGILVQTGNVDEMVSATRRIIEDTDFAANIAENACQIRNLLSVDRISDEWLKVIMRL